MASATYKRNAVKSEDENAAPFRGIDFADQLDFRTPAYAGSPGVMLNQTPPKGYYQPTDRFADALAQGAENLDQVIPGDQTGSHLAEGFFNNENHPILFSSLFSDAAAQETKRQILRVVFGKFTSQTRSDDKADKLCLQIKYFPIAPKMAPDCSLRRPFTKCCCKTIPVVTLAFPLLRHLPNGFRA